MAWDTIGNVKKDAGNIKSALESWETSVAPTSVDDFEITETGSGRVVITINYTA